MMSGASGCKIDDVVERYGMESPHEGFESVDESLLALWTGGDGFDARGYRSLTEWFNKRLLRHVYREHGRVVMGSRIDDEFATLTGEEEIPRSELLHDLERDGIDGDDVLADMVSWSTMRRHLLDCLDGEKPRQSAETNWERESVDIAIDQLVEKVQKALTSYENKDRITGAMDVDVSVQVQLTCPKCPTRRSLSEALELGYVCREHVADGTSASGRDPPETTTR